VAIFLGFFAKRLLKGVGSREWGVEIGVFVRKHSVMVTRQTSEQQPYSLQKGKFDTVGQMGAKFGSK